MSLDREALLVAFRSAASSPDLGIGTLSEKLIHKTLKYYIEPDSAFHEVKHEGFVADIMKDGCITEIQSSSFQYLRKKLEAFLISSSVTLVCPIRQVKYIITKSADGSVKRKKSPMHKGLSDVAIELYKIREFLDRPNLSVKLMFLEIEAERTEIEGKTKARYEKGIAYPTALLSEATLRKKDDFRIFLPDDLGERFLAKDFYRSIGATAKFSYYALKLCEYLGFISAVGKKGNAIIYERKI